MNPDPSALAMPSVPFPDFQLYIVRVWREAGTLERGWRASVRSSDREERRHFACAEDLLEHLAHELSRPYP